MSIADTVRKIFGSSSAIKNATKLEREYAEAILRRPFEASEIEREVAVSLMTGRDDILAISHTSTPIQVTTSASGTPKSSSILDTLLKFLIPKTKDDSRRLAKDWYETDDLYGGLVDTKSSFISSGFRLTVSKTQPLVTKEVYSRAKELADSASFSGDPDFVLNTVKSMVEGESDAVATADVDQTLLFEFELEHRLSSVVKTLAKDYTIYQSMILYWRIGGSQDSVDGVKSRKKGITDISAICPADVKWVNSLGRDLLYVELPKEIISKIRSALERYNAAEKIRLLDILVNEEGIPIEYIIAVSKGKTSVLLDKNDGHRWIIATEERKSHGLASPGISTKMALPMATRKLLTEGDYSAAIMMKHFITHITSGEPAPTSSANPKATWTSKKMTDTLLALFTSPSKAPVISTDHTVNVKYIYPPIEFFSADKYSGVNSRIFDFVGVSVSVYSGTGSKYSGGFLSIRRMVNSISDTRRIVKFCLEAMFFSDEVRSFIKVPDGHYIKVIFGEQGLKDSKQLFDEVKFMVEKHMLGPDQAGELLGHDPGSLRSGVEIAGMDDVVTGVWGGNYSVFSEKEKTFDNDISKGKTGAGRPPNEGTVVSEETRLQSPKPQ